MADNGGDQSPPPMTRESEPTAFVEMVNGLRKEIKETAGRTKEMVGLTKTSTPSTPESARNEMIANLMLAYRHLEDASMRLGKAIQASDGGRSVYDRETTVGA